MGQNEHWLIAREMSAEEWRQTDVGQFLNQILRQSRSLPDMKVYVWD